MKSITIGIGTITCGHDRYTGRQTPITAYGSNAPEIEADALLRAASRFAPDAVLEVNTEYQISEVRTGGEPLNADEAATRLPGITEPRLYYASLRVRELRQ